MMSDSVAPPAPAARLLLPFSLLALAMLILLVTLLVNSVRNGRALREQIALTDAQGEQAVAARMHYFDLFRELVDLAAIDPDAQAIVDRFNIQFSDRAEE